MAEPLRELRVGLTLLNASSEQDDGLIAEWFEAERVAGLAQATESMRRLGLLPAAPRSQDEVDAIVAAGGPLNAWARDFANHLQIWRRKGATKAELRGLINPARSLH